jgi:hypothetical protein
LVDACPEKYPSFDSSKSYDRMKYLDVTDNTCSRAITDNKEFQEIPNAILQACKIDTAVFSSV